MANGVLQHSPPRLEMLSQLPPVPGYTAELKVKLVRGLALLYPPGRVRPPRGMVKLIGFTWVKTLVPTVTLTGTVTLLPEAVKRSWPTYVPAVEPPPGKDAGVIPTVTIDGAVPTVTGTSSQLPPSAVLAVTVQGRAPVPPFSICIFWDGGVPPGSIEKLAWPATSQKNVPPAGATIRLTRTVIVMVPLG